MACEGLRIRMDRLDGIVLKEISQRILQPQRLGNLLMAYIEAAGSRVHEHKDRLGKMRQSHKEAEADISRLLSLVEKGLIDAEDPSLKERLVCRASTGRPRL